MSQIVTAVYEEGVLRPLHPLNLRDRQQVRLQLLPDDSEENETSMAVRILVEAGLMRSPKQGTPPPDPVSREERLALAKRISQAPGKSLSDIVIEDRGER
jgi:predicted DNA-binding antitoxin AbrB/MazE fold protein